MWRLSHARCEPAAAPLNRAAAVRAHKHDVDLLGAETQAGFEVAEARALSLAVFNGRPESNGRWPAINFQEFIAVMEKGVG